MRSLQGGIDAALSTTVLGLIGTLLGTNVGNRKRYLAAVIDRSRQLLVERDQHSQLAAAAERARIAREMHDIVSHSLTVIVALSEGAAATPDAKRARAASAAAAATGRSALSEMRAMLGVLRDDDADAPLTAVTAPSPQETVENAQRAGYPVSLTLSGAAPELPSATVHAISRIVQESVTNAMRHAPNATSVSVHVAFTPATVALEIVNDGAAALSGTSGFGLRGLAERAAHAGGGIEYGPAGSGYWRVRAELPAAPEGMQR
ncbi:histidine kinase [Microbacterium sp. SD291]|uniref:sensor histidine kinase n=1 Tax=Microbacterium sp. SD291 TaxID=2782007 RepID=UPI0027DB5712|nr:histidine kinase [Microbacterium sp. SD291]